MSWRSTSTSRSTTSRTRPTCCARSSRRQGGRDGFVSLEVSPYLAMRHRGDDRGGAAPLARGRAAEPDGQGAGDRAGSAGDPRADRRGHQHQHHAAVLAGRSTRQVAEAYHRRPRASCRARAAIRARSPASPASSSAASTRGRQAQSTSAFARPNEPPSARRFDGPERQGRDRQRQARLPALQAPVRGRALGAAGAQGRARRSGCCGPPPAPRTRPTATCSTSRS